LVVSLAYVLVCRLFALMVLLGRGDRWKDPHFETLWVPITRLGEVEPSAALMAGPTGVGADYSVERG
jgi:hypothetical protein